MTVNERLAARGLLANYLECERRKDRKEMVALLTQAAFTRKQAREIADNILLHPERFGLER